MARGIATADGLEDFHLHGTTEGRFPNSLMGGASAVALDVMRFARAVTSGGAIAAVGVDGTITDVDGVALAPGFKTGMQGFDELFDAALALFGDVPLELEAVETSAAAFTE